MKKLILPVYLGLHRLMMKLCWNLFVLLPLNPQKAVFSNFNGGGYGDNPKFIAQEFLRRGLSWKLYWVSASDYNLPKGILPLRPNTIAFAFHMATAGTWVDDTRKLYYFKKRPRQFYIQTWHGTPLKKLAFDMEAVSMSGSHDIRQYRKEFADNTKTWDCLIAQNVFSARIFPRCFAFSKRMLCIGYPRNDVLFARNHPQDRKAIRQELGLPDKKILLYAPTWRDDEYDPDGVYQFRPSLDFARLREALEKDYVIAVKYHYLVGDRIDWSGLEDFVYPFNAQAEISSLYLAADALITDYSSVMFDYSLLHRPMYFYTYDLEKYRDELRGFYFDFLAEAPGPISLTTEELIQDIRQYGTEIGEEFQEKTQAFYEKFHTYETGTASDKVIEEIENWQPR